MLLDRLSSGYVFNRDVATDAIGAADYFRRSINSR